ncbi:MAG TPA: ATP-binding cassette domain-containing protein [Steroidobacteraceae bacterium]|jgi:ATP-binding cassette subfamily F protein 3
MLNFTDVTLRRGPRVLFSGATFGLFRGEKVGITGENGSGKSSLLSLVRGELQSDAGTFEMPSNLSIAQVSQELEPVETAAIEFVLDGDVPLRALERSIDEAQASDQGLRLGELYAHYGAAGGYDARSRAGRLLHGLGFTPADESRPVRAFSGGWRVRLNLAQALMCRSDLLLLDEPTNHLDLDAILWLETWLLDYSGTLLLIAHDREFLDRITNRIVNLEHGHARAYRGNYSSFEEQRAAELAEQSALYVRQQREIRHMESFVERFRAKASKARQAQSRLKALERMERIAPAHVDSPFEFSFARPDKLPRPLLTLEEQSAGYGARVVLEPVNLTLDPGERLALLGRNGAGKSTYMKLLAGELAALSGHRTEARDLRIGYFAQHQLEQLSVGDSPLANLRRVGAERAGRAKEQELRDFLASFGFRGDRVFEPVAPFSGGEKARLVLALITYRRPNLLLLDEPTNHLDLEMRQALSVALQDYEGAVVLVSHDRHLLRTVADRFQIVHGGRAMPFDGDLEDYAKWLSAKEAPAPAAPITETESAPVTASLSGSATAPGAISASAATGAISGSAAARQKRRDEAERRNRLTPLKARVAKYDAELARLVRETQAVQAALTEPAVYDSEAKDRLRELLLKQAHLTRETERAEAQWLEASEQLEASGREAD